MSQKILPLQKRASHLRLQQNHRVLVHDHNQNSLEKASLQMVGDKTPPLGDTLHAHDASSQAFPVRQHFLKKSVSPKKILHLNLINYGQQNPSDPAYPQPAAYALAGSKLTAKKQNMKRELRAAQEEQMRQEEYFRRAPRDGFYWPPFPVSQMISENQSSQSYSPERLITPLSHQQGFRVKERKTPPMKTHLLNTLNNLHNKNDRISKQNHAGSPRKSLNKHLDDSSNLGLKYYFDHQKHINEKEQENDAIMESQQTLLEKSIYRFNKTANSNNNSSKLFPSNKSVEKIYDLNHSQYVDLPSIDKDDYSPLAVRFPPSPTKLKTIRYFKPAKPIQENKALLTDSSFKELSSQSKSFTAFLNKKKATTDSFLVETHQNDYSPRSLILAQQEENEKELFKYGSEKNYFTLVKFFKNTTREETNKLQENNKSLVLKDLKNNQTKPVSVQTLIYQRRQSFKKSK